jgi:hypothetical protein
LELAGSDKLTFLKIIPARFKPLLEEKGLEGSDLLSPKKAILFHL